MSGAIRNTWSTVRAMGCAGRAFFVRWFLPLHSKDEEPETVGWWGGEGPKSTEPEESNAPALEDKVADDASAAPVLAAGPVVAAPQGAEDRVARGAIEEVFGGDSEVVSEAVSDPQPWPMK